MIQLRSNFDRLLLSHVGAVPQACMQVQAASQEALVQQVCEIPANLHRQPGKTVYDLIRASGYLAGPDLLTRDAVLHYLQSHPATVESWQEYSEKKRTNRGWYFTTDRSDVEVGYFKAGDGFSNVQQYNTRDEACAEFILKEARDLALESAGCLTMFFEAVFGFIALVTRPFRR